MWDPQQNTFVLTNAAHKDFFQQLLISYQAIDKSGCSLIGTATLPTQTGISFSQLYTKYPRASWYCSQSQGILPTNLMFFLKAKKAIQEGIDGKNIGTDDINDVSL